MSEPKKHHFVPEVYLQRFAINKEGDLFKLNVKNIYKNNPTKKVNKSQICYEEYRYKFKSEKIIKANNLKDTNYIEKQKFNYENKDLTEIFDKIDYSKRLFVREARKLVDILLNIKFRNPSVSNKFLTQKTKEDIIKNHSKRLMKDMLSDNIPLEKANLMIKELQNRLIKNLQNEDYALDLYRNNLLEQDEEVIKEKNKLIEEILHWDFIVHRTDYQNPFITSDNPGYTLNGFSNCYNCHFDNIDSFVFPLSPTRLITIKKTISNRESILYKKIHYVNSNMVLIYNQLTIKTANRFILGGNEDQLNIMLKYWESSQ